MTRKSKKTGPKIYVTIYGEMELPAKRELVSLLKTLAE